MVYVCVKWLQTNGVCLCKVAATEWCMSVQSGCNRMVYVRVKWLQQNGVCPLVKWLQRNGVCPCKVAATEWCMSTCTQVKCLLVDQNIRYFLLY